MGDESGQGQVVCVCGGRMWQFGGVMHILKGKVVQGVLYGL